MSRSDTQQDKTLSLELAGLKVLSHFITSSLPTYTDERTETGVVVIRPALVKQALRHQEQVKDVRATMRLRTRQRHTIAMTKTKINLAFTSNTLSDSLEKSTHERNGLLPLFVVC
eukprot:GHVN01010183.1.p2 GENE.GHVN01010183.1~~GHVN01010183.1.p2  ORF type:complete len:115 (+),score=7.94 GHVN01010183.1:301-645(+)